MNRLVAALIFMVTLVALVVWLTGVHSDTSKAPAAATSTTDIARETSNLTGLLAQQAGTASLRQWSAAMADLDARLEHSVLLVEVREMSRPGEVWSSRTGTSELEGDATISWGVAAVLRADGILLTSYGLIQGANSIRVRLPDGTMVPASVVGCDRATDVAVLRIKRDGLDPLDWADADKIRPGEMVAAMGAGAGRVLFSQTAAVISTDAGEVLNTDDAFQRYLLIHELRYTGGAGTIVTTVAGELVGFEVNASGPLSGAAGASPVLRSDAAKTVVDLILEHGHVPRGYLGMSVTDLSPELASVLGVAASKGVVVQDVLTAGPASSAGIEPKDVIIGLNEVAVTGAGSFADAIARTKPGTAMVLTVLKGKITSSVPVTVAEKPIEPGDFAELATAAPEAAARGGRSLLLEFTVVETKERKGLSVSRVDSDSHAAKAGLRPGMILLEVQGVPVDSLVDYNAAADRLGATGPVLLYVQDPGNGRRFLTLK